MSVALARLRVLRAGRRVTRRGGRWTSPRTVRNAGRRASVLVTRSLLCEVCSLPTRRCSVGCGARPDVLAATTEVGPFHTSCEPGCIVDCMTAVDCHYWHQHEAVQHGQLAHVLGCEPLHVRKRRRSPRIASTVQVSTCWIGTRHPSNFQCEVDRLSAMMTAWGTNRGVHRPPSATFKVSHIPRFGAGGALSR